MPDRITDRAAMIAGMNPTLDAREWAFVAVADQAQAIALMGCALASFREVEGLSLIVPHGLAEEHGLAAPPYARITLQVHSGLEGVGLTAAVSAALTQAAIACNVVAAYHHDHVFVPAADAQQALTVLQNLQADNQS